MTSKDLHLSLDERLIGPNAVLDSTASGAAASSGASSNERPSAREAPFGAARYEQVQPQEPVLTSMPAEHTNGLSSRPAAESPAQRSGSHVLWLLALLLCAANIAVLCAGGYWLYRQNLLQPPAAVFSGAELQPQIQGLQSQLVELQTALGALDARVQQLQVADSDELQQINSALLDLQSATALALSNESAAATATPATAKVQAPQWRVSVETFLQQPDARALSARLRAMSFPATVEQVDVDGQTGFRVELTGFSTREQAEQAAGNLMGKVDINGLWVWKAD